MDTSRNPCVDQRRIVSSGRCGPLAFREARATSMKTLARVDPLRESNCRTKSCGEEHYPILGRPPVEGGSPTKCVLALEGPVPAQQTRPTLGREEEVLLPTNLRYPASTLLSQRSTGPPDISAATRIPRDEPFLRLGRVAVTALHILDAVVPRRRQLRHCAFRDTRKPLNTSFGPKQWVTRSPSNP